MEQIGDGFDLEMAPNNAHIAVEYSMRVAAFHKHPETWLHLGPTPRI
jgi:hypothetical protein